jgi:hypothetical protein
MPTAPTAGGAVGAAASARSPVATLATTDTVTAAATRPRQRVDASLSLLDPTWFPPIEFLHRMREEA